MAQVGNVILIVALIVDKYKQNRLLQILIILIRLLELLCFVQMQKNILFEECLRTPIFVRI